MVDKQVNIKVAASTELSEIDALENKIGKLRQERLQFQIDTNNAKLIEVQNKIDALDAAIINPHLNLSDADLKKIQAEKAQLEQDAIDLNIKIHQDELNQVESKIDSLDPSDIEVNVDNISAMQGLDQIGQGIDRLKAGAGEVAGKMGEMLESSGRMEQTEAFLGMNLGADVAKKKLGEIRSVTDSLPGDDVALQSLLSQATLKDANMTTEAYKQMGSAAADYMAAMNNYGKSATETQQDLMNYILAGNTAEIERSPLLQAHVDKLKEGTTVQERAKLLAEALNEEGWAGISQQDTYNNKLQSFNDMLERGKMNMGGLFREGTEGAMEFLVDLDEATHGLVGMGAAIAGLTTPLAESLMGITQIVQGFKSMKEAGGFIKNIPENLSKLKTKLVEVAISAKNTAVSLLNVGKNAIISGANALKSAALWAAQKTALIATTIAEYTLAAAQAILNAVMSMNPIMLVVIALVALAAALIWAYSNVAWFRDMVNSAWAALVQFGGYIYGVITGAIQWLGDLFNQFTQQLGLNTDDWIQAILGFILFLPQLPLQLGIVLVNAIAKVLGFGDDFVGKMKAAAQGAVDGFANYISELPGKLKGELDEMLQMASDFIMKIADMLTGGAAGMVVGWITGSGEHSPGYMYDAFAGELESMKAVAGDFSHGIPHVMNKAGAGMVDTFNPSFGLNGDGGVANNPYAPVINLSVNVDHVDSKDRVREIVDVIKRELQWNNTTAGRTI